MGFSSEASGATSTVGPGDGTSVGGGALYSTKYMLLPPWVTASLDPHLSDACAITRGYHILHKYQHEKGRGKFPRSKI